MKSAGYIYIGAAAVKIGGFNGTADGKKAKRHWN